MTLAGGAGSGTCPGSLFKRTYTATRGVDGTAGLTRRAFEGRGRQQDRHRSTGAFLGDDWNQVFALANGDPNNLREVHVAGRDRVLVHPGRAEMSIFTQAKDYDEISTRAASRQTGSGATSRCRTRTSSTTGSRSSTSTGSASSSCTSAPTASRPTARRTPASGSSTTTVAPAAGRGDGQPLHRGAHGADPGVDGIFCDPAHGVGGQSTPDRPTWTPLRRQRHGRRHPRPDQLLGRWRDRSRSACSSGSGRRDP